MNIGHRLIKNALSIIIFCIGVFLLMYNSKRFHEALQTARNHIKDQVIFQQYNDSEELIVPFSELIASLYYPQDYDIQIDDFVINKLNYNVSKITSYGIKKINYKKSYRYDELGNMKRVIYQGMQGG